MSQISVFKILFLRITSLLNFYGFRVHFLPTCDMAKAITDYFKHHSIKKKSMSKMPRMCCNHPVLGPYSIASLNEAAITFQSTSVTAAGKVKT